MFRNDLKIKKGKFCVENMFMGFHCHCNEVAIQVRIEAVYLSYCPPLQGYLAIP